MILMMTIKSRGIFYKTKGCLNLIFMEILLALLCITYDTFQENLPRAMAEIIYSSLSLVLRNHGPIFPRAFFQDKFTAEGETSTGFYSYHEQHFCQVARESAKGFVRNVSLRFALG